MSEVSSQPVVAPEIALEEAPANPPPAPKLPRLNSNQRIRKRPLLHPAIAPPRSAATTPKIIYISNHSNFVVTIKRVRTLLNHIETRALGADATSLLRKDPHTVLRTISHAVREGKGKERRGEEVIMKASGKAIEKGLRLAAWWSAQEDVTVELRTGSVGAIDDIVDKQGVEEESRVRNVSYLEVCVKLV
ncbi:hypothetical protein K3495_g8096 [Podosphaera aphanis]|nr:hypothetical protein K3495_g8096 [Podosphaera aphanis]